MKTIKVENWKAVDNGKEVDENIIAILTALLNNKKPEEMPRGFEQARMFNRIIKAFDNSITTKELVLDDVDYEFLKEMIKKDTPAIWGANQNIMKALEGFNNA